MTRFTFTTQNKNIFYLIKMIITHSLPSIKNIIFRRELISHLNQIFKILLTHGPLNKNKSAL